MTFKLHALPLFLILTTSLTLTSCGGGGGSSSGGNSGTISPTIPTSSNPTWTPGSFQNESAFDARCAAPRSGTNPATGVSYPDSAGSTTWENHWIRAWSYRTYLWYDELPDLNPASYSDPLAYFDTQKSTATTATGTPRDQFHFTVPTDEYFQSVSTGSSAGYGFRVRLVRPTIPRETRVAYTENSGPAFDAGILRGAEILEIDGVDVIFDATNDGIDTLNAGLFPSSAGETHTFLIQNPGEASPRTVTLTTETVTADPVRVTKTIENAGQNVGYIQFNTFGTITAESAIIDAITELDTSGIDDLVLDLRYNGGGFLDISSELAYMVAGPLATDNANYETTLFNDKHPTTNPVTGQALSPTPFHDTAQGFNVTNGTALPSLGLDRVFVLSTGSTCSASEALINGLRGIDVDVILIGDTTCGKPYGFYATDNCGTTYFTVQFAGVNEKGFGDFSDGFTPNDTGSNSEAAIPGCTIGDDFDNQLGEPEEALLNAALTYQATGACPATPTSAAPLISKPVFEDPATSLLNDPRVQRRIWLEQSSWYGHPVGQY